MQLQWIRLKTVSSTNNHILELLRRDDVEKELAVVAEYQTGGRGQGSKGWHSNRGENLLMSVLLFPAFLSASGQFRLSVAASLAVCDFLRSKGLDTKIKWPNDIVSVSGKLAGILIEHGICGRKLVHSVIGTGINLNQTRFPSFPVPASSVRLETGRFTPVDEAAEQLAARIEERYEHLKQGGAEAQEREYHRRLTGLGESSVFDTADGILRGIVKGVNAYGQLLVESGEEIRAFDHGSIRVL